MFADRTDAGRQLADKLQSFQVEHPLILALPRGGVVVAAVIARALHCDLDVSLVKKLRAPRDPELAVGALSEDGFPYINKDVAQTTGADESYLQYEIKERRAEIIAQQESYRKIKPHIPVTGRTAILVDDGLATGATMIAAVQATALARPAKLVVAVPVSPPDTVRTLKAMPQLDEVICLSTPPWFSGVGQFYEDFTQVSDDEVVALLRNFV